VKKLAKNMGSSRDSLMGGNTRQASLGFNEDRNRLPPSCAGILFVPVADRRFAQFPAKTDIAAMVTAGKVDQALVVILQIAANLGQLVDVIFEEAHHRIQISLQRDLVFDCRMLDCVLQSRCFAMSDDDVIHHARNQRKRADRLLKREVPSRARRLDGLGGEELRTRHKLTAFLGDPTATEQNAIARHDYAIAAKSVNRCVNFSLANLVPFMKFASYKAWSVWVMPKIQARF
jgi:hypothetical protein